MKLISMTSFVLQKAKELENRDDCEFAYIIRKYAKFLIQPLNLGMFVPCDENGNPISEFYSVKENTENSTFAQLSNQYQIAKQKVLFEGFYIECQNLMYKIDDKNWFCCPIKEITELKIEHLIESKPTLTQSAINQLQLT